MLEGGLESVTAGNRKEETALEVRATLTENAAGIMSHVLLTGLLIALSVICQCDGAPRQFDLLAKTALNLPENIQNKYEVQRLEGEMNAGLCWLCKRTIGELMALAKHEIRKEINTMCKKFKHFERNCKAQAYKYETMAIHLLFHGNNARDSCKQIHLC